MSIKNAITKGFFSTIALVVIGLFFITGSFAASAPRLNLFPRDVAEHLSNTGQTAKAMENRLKEVITGLDTQMRLYQASGCEGSIDPGCEEIAKQMGEHYQEMLTIMQESLPEMKHSVVATNKAIQSNLRKELGKKTTPAGIQKMLSSKSKPKVVNGRFSLSKRFAKYHALIRAGNGNSLVKLAAEIYLDTSEVIKMIDLMEAEMTRQETIISLGRMYGTITPEMTNTVESVKSVIFGEPESETALPKAMGEKEDGFHSPLALD